MAHQSPSRHSGKVSVSIASSITEVTQPDGLAWSGVAQPGRYPRDGCPRTILVMAHEFDRGFGNGPDLHGASSIGEPAHTNHISIYNQVPRMGALVQTLALILSHPPLRGFFFGVFFQVLFWYAFGWPRRLQEVPKRLSLIHI